MRFAFIAKHRSIWPVAWLCEALDVSRSGFSAWLNRSPRPHARYDEKLLLVIDRSFRSSDRTYGARRDADLKLHQPSSGKADHLAQNIGVRALLDKRPEVHHVIGRRWSFRVRVGVDNQTLPEIRR